MKNRKWAVLLAVVILLAGIAIEGLFNAGLLRLPDREKGITQLDLSQAETDGFRMENGTLVMEEDRESASFYLKINEIYADKLCYDFSFTGALVADIYVDTSDIYGNPEMRKYEDRSPYVLNCSYVNVRCRISGVHFTVSRADQVYNGTEFPGEIRISGMQVKNIPAVNGYRLVFFWCVLTAAALLFWFRRVISEHVEYGFALIALTAGLLMIWMLPAGKTGWDEEVHFTRAYELSVFPSAVVGPEELYTLTVASAETWPLNLPDSLEENAMHAGYWNEHAQLGCEEVNLGRGRLDIYTPGYVSQALFIKAARALNLSFSAVYRAGRLGNLLLYILMMFLAIRILPVGKRILAVMGLMPTPMFLASVYSYDAAIISFLAVGIALVIRELMTPQKKVEWKTYLTAGAAMVWGCLPKAVYAPLVLTALALPKEKFKDKRQMWLMRAGIAAAFLALMATFVLPALISPAETGDLRGGDTSHAGQLTYILGQPFAYAAVLFKCIWSTLTSYTAGEGVYGLMGHVMTSPFVPFITMLIIYVVVTDNTGTVRERIKGKQKLWLFLTCAACVVLIWTAMYMSFTPVGSSWIQGVQGRYYLPFLFILYLVVHSPDIRNQKNQAAYTGGVMLAAAVILYATVYWCILLQMCM